MKFREKFRNFRKFDKKVPKFRNFQNGSGLQSLSMGDDTVDQWQKRLEACIRTEGGQFEHLL